MSFIIALPIGYKPVLKHGDHDQSSHGSWATGITAELSEWSPKDSVPASPRNAGGMTEKIWDNWEHGVDGYQYVELYRQYAGEALGLAVPKSDMDTGGQLNYLTTRGFGGSSTDAAKNQAEAMLKAIANGKPEQPALYRGMVATEEVSQALIKEITNLKAGDTLDMPLVSTTRSLGVASWYALDRSARGTDSVIMKIQDGAKGVSLTKENSWYPQDHEVITSGKFEVVGISKIETPYWKRETLEPREQKWTDGSPTSYEIVGTKQSLGDPKKVYEAVTSGNWKSLETPTFKLTDDRRSSPERPILSAWVKQPAREVTVVEVKFVDSHVVKKADKKDYGLTFDALFNDIPFIRDEEDVAKHGEHDQSSHGAWASGEPVADIEEWAKSESSKFSSETEQEIYLLERTMSQAKGLIDGKYKGAVNAYQTATGYTINEALRDPQISEGQVQPYIDGLDNAIKDAIPTTKDMTVYRGIKGNGLDFFESLKSGDVFQDKGFVSTTLDPKTVTKFSVQGGMYQGIVMRMQIPAGSKGLFPMSVTGMGQASSREAEFILPRDSKFKILSNEGKVWNVEVVND
jgi:hypothetical protein